MRSALPAALTASVALLACNQLAHDDPGENIGSAPLPVLNGPAQDPITKQVFFVLGQNDLGSAVDVTAPRCLLTVGHTDVVAIMHASGPGMALERRSFARPTQSWNHHGCRDLMVANPGHSPGGRGHGRCPAGCRSPTCLSILNRIDIS